MRMKLASNIPSKLRQPLNRENGAGSKCRAPKIWLVFIKTQKTTERIWHPTKLRLPTIAAVESPTRSARDRRARNSCSCFKIVSTCPCIGFEDSIERPPHNSAFAKALYGWMHPTPHSMRQENLRPFHAKSHQSIK